MTTHLEPQTPTQPQPHPECQSPCCVDRDKLVDTSQTKERIRAQLATSR